MRRDRKKELLELLDTLIEANEYIRKNVDNITDVTIDVLMQCHEGAISIGNCIEACGEAAEPIVRILESYCENIYKISQCIIKETTIDELIKETEEQLRQVRKDIYYNIPEDKKEIVFFPYTASMWDSLESIWKAVAQDKEYDTYVVPIPYFDKNSDGTLGQMHYEGNEYPCNVPIISWEKYNIEERRPDVIYIHNPYDECNRVTSVHPNFYSKRLKRYTNKLVYVPYFVGINDNVPRHFCVLPGVLHADQVIVESEKVRDIYLEELYKFERENNCINVFGKMEDKVVALGSPKYDKIVTSNKEDFMIPESWKKLIVKADGHTKKIILYNTTIQAMLIDRSRMLDKIEKVLEFFKNQEDITLLWRPHPLLKSTLQSMLPSLLERYSSIESEYRAQGWGIFDDSADLYRAITLSDAYYGDWSSLIELYKQTGKPIMIQSIEMIDEEGI